MLKNGRQIDEMKLTGHVKDVNFELLVTNVHFGNAIVDANCLQILLNEPFLTVTFDDAALATLAVTKADDFNFQGLS